MDFENEPTTQPNPTQPNLTINAFKYEFHVPVHIVHIDNASKIIVEGYA